MKTRDKIKLAETVRQNNERNVREWDEARKIRGVLVDVETGEAKEAIIEKSLDSYYEVLNCRCIDIAHRAICGKPFDIICDDEARLVENPIPSAVNNRGEVDLCGNLFIVKFDGCDDVKSLSSAEVSFILKNTFPAMVERQNARRAITVVRNIGYCRR